MISYENKKLKPGAYKKMTSYVFKKNLRKSINKIKKKYFTCSIVRLFIMSQRFLKGIFFVMLLFYL
jgi:hypothetical protein